MSYLNSVEMIKTLFSKTKIENIYKIEYLLKSAFCDFKVDNTLRLAHFLAQVREEIGDEFKPVFENLNYSEEVLPKLFKSFGNNDFAKKYGRNEMHSANEKMIASIAYANRLGNGDISSYDGWKYRGAGALQITGKANYLEVQKRIDRYIKDLNIDILNNDDINTLEGFLAAGLGFWIWKDIFKKADLGKDLKTVDKVTKVINRYTNSYEKRRQHFYKIEKYIIV
ncbi:glycoside hydrolase family 19 protein [Arcobacter sp. CECT 8985]|uniref:glycoside hydrolase family 19 protein n=1 Tax=Arcobacter sp. CECT 8985 TaxID=1935424 RepID=UPI00100B10C3|nr:glycoside hydrolase family 19 protein [Arcobacter sp. CECT 8985]RXJ85250.1 hypothetical protein CRU93_11480 [Arcobacter sp. CECT 8985]